MQVVTEEEWAARAERFPGEPPKTREYYLLRSIFQKHFPSKSAYETVPRVRSSSYTSSMQLLESPRQAATLIAIGIWFSRCPQLQVAISRRFAPAAPPKPAQTQQNTSPTAC